MELIQEGYQVATLGIMLEELLFCVLEQLAISNWFFEVLDRMAFEEDMLMTGALPSEI